ncbi:hypothetical protein WA158_006213 [Blastocystis sp. Blastoise]
MLSSEQSAIIDSSATLLRNSLFSSVKTYRDTTVTCMQNIIDCINKQMVELQQLFSETSFENSTISYDITEELRSIAVKLQQSYHSESSFDDLVCDDNEKIAFLRPNNLKPIMVSKRVLQKNPGCYFSLLTHDPMNQIAKNTYYLDSSDENVSTVLDYLEEKPIHYKKFKEEIEKLNLIESFEFFNVPFRKEILQLQETFKDHKKRIWIQEGMILVNDHEVPEIIQYLKKTNQLANFLSTITNKQLQWSDNENAYYVNLHIDLFQYIVEYIKTNSISKESYLKEEFSIETFLSSLSILCIKMNDSIKQRFYPLHYSSILYTNEQYINQINTWVNLNKKWILSYKGSDHDFSSTSFHDLCDNQGETLVLISSYTGTKLCVFGGYTKIGWIHNNNKSYYGIKDPDAFIFTLQNPYNTIPSQFSCISKDEYTIEYDINRGPIFRYGFSISNDCHKNSTNFINIYSSPSIYTYHPIYMSSLFTNTNNYTENNYFKVNEIEVYTCHS